MEKWKAQGLTVPCTSPYNIPILPVKKSNGRRWRFVQDLQVINIMTILVVPNPCTLLGSIQLEANSSQYFIYAVPSFVFWLMKASSSTFWFSLGRENNSPGQQSLRALLKVLLTFHKS